MTTQQPIMTRAAWIALLAGETACDTCNGSGRIPLVGKRGTRACPACHGKGVPRARQRVFAREPERRAAA